MLPVSGLQLEVDEVRRRWRAGRPGLFPIPAGDSEEDQGWKPLTGRVLLEGRRHWPEAMTPLQHAWFCVFAERVPGGTAVAAEFSNEAGEKLPGRITYIGSLFWAAEVYGLYPYIRVTMGETSHTADLRPFSERNRGEGWFKFEHINRRIL